MRILRPCGLRMTGEEDAFKTHFFFPAGKRNGFWDPKKKGLLRIGALCGVRRRPASLRPHRGPAPAVTAYVGGTGKSGRSISPPPGRCESQRGSPGGHRPPAAQSSSKYWSMARRSCWRTAFTSELGTWAPAVAALHPQAAGRPGTPGLHILGRNESALRKFSAALRILRRQRRPPLNPPRSTGRWPGGAAGERRLRPNWGPGRRRWRRCRRRPAFPAPPGRWCCPCCGRR